MAPTANMSSSSQVWFITGCSSGFGQEFTRHLLARGDKVIATARNSSKLKDLEELGADILELDVTIPEPVIQETMSKAVQIYGRIDVLVNNAGYVASGSWEDLRCEDWQAALDTNFLGPIKVTRAILPHFRERKAGVMVFIGSLSGWVGHGFTGAYACTKFALEGAVESLYRETTPLGLRTILLEPGRFRTPLLSDQNLRATYTKLDVYKTAADGHNSALRDGSMQQPGDPQKFVQLAIDLVKEQGVARDRVVPFRLPVGIDAVQEITSKIHETARLIEDWRDIITNTDRD